MKRLENILISTSLGCMILLIPKIKLFLLHSKFSCQSHSS